MKAIELLKRIANVKKGNKGFYCNPYDLGKMETLCGQVDDMASYYLTENPLRDGLNTAIPADVVFLGAIYTISLFEVEPQKRTYYAYVVED